MKYTPATRSWSPLRHSSKAGSASFSPAATLKQVQTYVKQANQFLLAQHGQRKRDQMYEHEHLETMIAAADNVARLRPAM
jgi:hypothetical protein